MLFNRQCPACGSRRFRPAVSTAEIREEIQLRRQFVTGRVHRKARCTELKDLLDFMHGFPAPVLACGQCGLLIRGESQVREARSYEEDPNDLDLMAQLYPLYLEAFRRKRLAYAPLLRPHADVLELGSHLGGFLQAAEEWNWSPVGLDVGKDTSEFVRRRGHVLQRAVLADARLKPESFHAVFAWNLFEQLEDPAAMLRQAHRLLVPHGLMVIRVPNAAFYRRLRAQRHGHSVLHAFAYNNLLGFPYLHGYTQESLDRLMANNAFEPVTGFNSELITMPFPDRTRRIVREQEATSRLIAQWSSRTTARRETLTGPWIELVYRRLSEQEWKSRSFVHGPVDLRFLPRAA